jgi:hypothetical protein
MFNDETIDSFLISQELKNEKKKIKISSES